MKPFDLIATLEGPWGNGTRPQDVFCANVLGAPYAHVQAIMQGLGHKSRRVQGGCAQVASMLSESYPEALYPHVDVFLRNLTSEAPILRWEAVRTVGNLANVDVDEKIPPHVDTIIAYLSHESVVLRGHAARALGKIAKACPELGPRILHALIAAEPHFPGSHVGFVLETMPVFASDEALRLTALRFVQRYVGSPVRVVASKATRALRYLDDASPGRRVAKRRATKG
jgi:hypothetical protein